MSPSVLSRDEGSLPAARPENVTADACPLGATRYAGSTVAGLSACRACRSWPLRTTGEKAKYRLVNGALYPMLAAFRWMVEDNPRNGMVRWRGGFKSVLRRWEESAAELMRMTAQASTELGRNPNAIGKSKNHWANLHARVAMRDLIEKTKTAV